MAASHYLEHTPSSSAAVIAAPGCTLLPTSLQQYPACCMHSHRIITSSCSCSSKQAADRTGLMTLRTCDVTSPAFSLRPRSLQLLHCSRSPSPEHTRTHTRTHAQVLPMQMRHHSPASSRLAAVESAAVSAVLIDAANHGFGQSLTCHVHSASWSPAGRLTAVMPLLPDQRQYCCMTSSALLPPWPQASVAADAGPGAQQAAIENS